MNRFMQYFLILLILTGFVYINEILKYPGDTFIEKYHNMSAYGLQLYEKELKKQQKENKG